MWWLRQIVALLLMCSVVARADAQALPAFTGAVNKVLGKTVEKTAQRRGFAANDPRMAATMTDMSTAAATVAGTVTAAAVAGSAPVWLSVVAGLGAAALVGGLVYGAYKIFFNDSSSQAMFTVQKPGAAGASMPTVPATKGWENVGSSLVRGTVAGRTVLMVGRAEGLNTDDPSVANKFDNNGYYIRSSEPYATKPYYALGNWWVQLVATDGPPTIAQLNMEAYIQAEGGTVTSKPPCTKAGNTYTCSVSYRFPWSGADAQAEAQITIEPNPYYSSPAQTVKGDVGTLVSNMEAGELSKPADAATVAYVANALWQRAAAKEGYQGVPYSASDPVTVEDAAAVQQADPAAWPKNADLIAPVASAANEPVAIGDSVASNPSSPTSPSTGPATNVNVMNTPTVRLDRAVDVNWGDAPTVHEPSINGTPTAQQILAPILNLMPGLKSLTIPRPAPECPTVSFNVFDTTFAVDTHCEVVNAARPTLFSVMAFVWLALGAMIVLRA